MDKSFSDDELSDIMKEIEALEEDFSPKDEQPSEPEAQAGPEEEAVEASVEIEVEAKEADSRENIVSLDSKRSAPKNSSEHSTSMSFKVQGNLSLELSFDIGGKVVSLEVTESGLSIEMEGGMKFSVPVSPETSLKKVA